MFTRQSPFSFYDFLGYFIPGAVTLYTFYVALKSSICLYKWDKQFSDRPSFFLPFILMSYVFGHILSFVSSITIEKYSNWTFGYPSKYLFGYSPKGIFCCEDKKVRRRVARFIVAVFMSPITLPDIVLGSWLNLRELYVKPSDKLTINVIKNNIIKAYRNVGDDAINKDLDDEGDEFFDKQSYFRYCYHYALENAPNHNPKMQNYVALFGFTRTLSLVFVLFYWLFAIHIFESFIFCKVGFGLLGGMSFFSYTFFLAFNKFNKKYTLESLMALSVSLQKQTEEKIGQN